MENNETRQSLSRQVKKSIIETIRVRELQAGDRFFSEKQLMDQFGVSRYTIREALALLEQDGIISRQQGKGTFVGRRPVQIQSGLERMESVTEIIRRQGLVPTTRWVSIRRHRPTEDMRSKLKLGIKEPVITFRRIRLADGEFAAYCVDTIGALSIPGYSGGTFGDGSMFQFLSDDYGIILKRATAEMVPVMPEAELRELVNWPQTQPLMLLHQIHFNAQDRPVVYSMDYFNPERFRFVVNRT